MHTKTLQVTYLSESNLLGEKTTTDVISGVAERTEGVRNTMKIYLSKRLTFSIISHFLLDKTMLLTSLYCMFCSRPVHYIVVWSTWARLDTGTMIQLELCWISKVPLYKKSGKIPLE